MTKPRRLLRSLEDKRPAIPSTEAVVELVGNLIGRHVTLDGSEPDVAIPDRGIVGAYLCDDGRLGAHRLRRPPDGGVCRRGPGDDAGGTG